MECKYINLIGENNMRMRINRYIMECKLLIVIPAVTSPFGINRYIMECKYPYPENYPLSI